MNEPRRETPVFTFGRAPIRPAEHRAADHRSAEPVAPAHEPGGSQTLVVAPPPPLQLPPTRPSEPLPESLRVSPREAAVRPVASNHGAEKKAAPGWWRGFFQCFFALVVFAGLLAGGLYANKLYGWVDLAKVFGLAK
jgi:hypothetical protein